MRFYRIVLNNLIERRTRSILTVLGVSIGIGAVVALVAISKGFVKTWTEMLSVRGTDITVMKKGVTDLLSDKMDERLKGEFLKIPGIKDVSGILGDLVWVDDRPNVVIFGFNPKEFVFEHIHPVSGRIEWTEGKDEIILGKILSEAIGKGVGDTVTIEQLPYEVVAVYDSGNIPENSGAIIPLETLQRNLSREGEVTAFNIRVELGADIEEICRKIESSFPDLTAMEIREAVETNQGVKLSRSIAWGTSFIAIIVGAIATMNTMAMSVFEKTREIGILRALGWRRRRIVYMIILESLFLCMASGIIGIILGILAIQLLNILPATKGYLSGYFDSTLFLEAMMIAIGLGLIGGLYPAIKGANLSPIDAIRRE